MSIYLSVYPSIHPTVRHLSIHPYIYRSVYPSIYPLVCLSAPLSFHIHLSFHPAIRLSECLYVNKCVTLSDFLTKKVVCSRIQWTCQLEFFAASKNQQNHLFLQIWLDIPSVYNVSKPSGSLFHFRRLSWSVSYYQTVLFVDNTLPHLMGATTLAITG